MCPLLQVVVSYYRIYFERGRWRGNTHTQFYCMLFHPFISMFIVTKVSFLLLCKNKCGCFNRVWHDSVLEAEQTGNMKTKAQSAHLAFVSLSGLLTRKWKHGSVHVHIFRGTCKMCRERVGVPRSFSQMSRLCFFFCQICFKNSLKLVLISMFSFSSLKAELVHFYNMFYDAYHK